MKESGISEKYSCLFAQSFQTLASLNIVRVEQQEMGLFCSQFQASLQLAVYSKILSYLFPRVIL